MKTSTNHVYNPVGTIIVVTGDIPSGYLECDGSSVSQVTYKALYETLTNDGSTFPYGANSGTDFKLPNLQGRTPVGGTQGTLGQTSGTENSGSEPLSLDVVSNITCNHSISANYNSNAGNYDVNAAANTGNHTITSANIPAHVHRVVSANIDLHTGNQRINATISRQQRSNTNSLYISSTANRNDYVRRQSGNGNSIRNDSVLRYRGQVSGDASRVPRQGNTMRHSEWPNRGNNYIVWGQAARRQLGGSHAHSSANAYANANISNNGVTSSRNSTGTANIVVNGHNFSVSPNAISVDYGNLEGKQVLVRYAIKF